MKNAIVLCSGGLDSVTSLYLAYKKLNYKNLKIMFFDYGQRTLKEEKKASLYFSNMLKAEFISVKLNFLKSISGSIINKSSKISQVKRKDLINSEKIGEKYYVPFRNSLFISNAISYAEMQFLKNNKKFDIIVGFKNEGKESFKDTTKEYVTKINELINIGCEVKTKLIAPLINLDKEDIISKATELNIPLEKTFSCYIGKNGLHCGECLACRLRQEGFYWANIHDKTKYASKMQDYRNPIEKN